MATESASSSASRPIKNIGDIDYYIGTTAQTDSTQQFEWGDCHNHRY